MSRTLRITLTVNGQPVTAVAPGPPRETRLDQLLPVLRALDDSVASARRNTRRRSCFR